MKKIPFDLNKWLKDTFQKVITRGGNSVRIICTNSRADQPIVALVTFTYEGGGTYESVETYNENGHYWAVGNKDADLDLFLVTDEEGLTDFEEELYGLLEEIRSFDEPFTCNELVDYAKKEAPKLLTIARKQLKAEGWEYTDPLFKKVCEEKLKQEPIPGGIAKCIQDHWWEMLDSNPSDAKTKKQRKPSPALTKIVENLTPEKLEKTKKDMAMEREEKDDNGNIVLSSFLQGYLPKIMEKYGLNDTQKGAIVEIAYDFYSKGKSEALKDLPEWSEEDVRHLYNIIFAVNNTYKNNMEQKVQLISWLKSLRPQSKDEIYKRTDEAYKLGKHHLAVKFMNYLDDNRPEGKMGLSNNECESIDKAFKENDWATIMRYVDKYRPSWKPSEEQMRIIQMVLTDEAMDDNVHNVLAKLYEQLKKLI